MTRLWAIAVLALVPVTLGFAQQDKKGGQDTKVEKGDKDIKIDGKLTKDDPKDKAYDQPGKVHTVKMTAGKIYVITMTSNDMDTFLRLEDRDGKELDTDDDGGAFIGLGGNDSWMVFKCPKDSDYKVICTSYFPNPDFQNVGDYTLTVKVGTEQDLKKYMEYKMNFKKDLPAQEALRIQPAAPAIAAAELRARD